MEAEFHDLDFGLALPTSGTGKEAPEDGDEAGQDDDEEHTQKQRASALATISGAKVTLRSNVSDVERWTLVPGDIVELWKPNFLVKDSKESSEFQHDEKMYYVGCAFCRRTIYEIRQQGPVDACSRHRCGEEGRPIPPNWHAAMTEPDGPPNGI